MALLGIDIGTSSCKVAAFHENGHVLTSASASYAVSYPALGYAEQRAEIWWDAACQAMNDLWKMVSPSSIHAVGVAGQGWSPVLLDKNGDVLAPTPLWLDTRATQMCDTWHEQGLEEKLFSVCGNPLQPGYVTPKLLWFKKHHPDMYTRISMVLQSNGYLTYRLTGALVQDHCNAYGWHFYDSQKDAWNTELCREMDLDPAFLPPLVPCSSIVGKVTTAAARQTGLLDGTPVVAGGLDAACGTFGAGVVLPGQTQEQGGQAGGMSICQDVFTADPRLILSRHVLPDLWLLQGGTTGGGGVMRWLSACFQESPRQLDQEAESVPPGSDGLIFLPYMAGERSPIWDPNAKGVFYGLDFGKSRGYIVRAALEGVAYSLRHNLEAAKDAGASVGTLFATGGSANSRLWTQMKADVTGHSIRVPASDTATTHGAAMLAGLGIGVYADGVEAVKQTVQFRQDYTPNTTRKEIYDEGYDAYLALSDTLAQKALETMR
ncbi:MAG: xylulokinase [Clostridium sp.]|jgi:xylulokinase|nr:xylulokinase [Clostridium sp.]